MKHGDVCEVEIESVSLLRNVVRLTMSAHR